MVDESCIFCKLPMVRFPRPQCMKTRDFRVILDLGARVKGTCSDSAEESFKDVCELDEKIAAKILPLGGKIELQ